MDDSSTAFFNIQFWRTLVIAVFTQVVVLLLAISVTLILSGRIETLISLSDSLNQTMITFTKTIETAMNVDTAEIQSKAEDLSGSVSTLSDGIGDGGANVIEKVDDAWTDFTLGWPKDENGELVK